ncbi:uracil-DNA glycosylase [Eubacteriales bacterium OttesenSCG-928-K08]|nr:uracil-DNA glycosylase [Eubacteriales bacterium OttesenSCG-928-K08]
MEDKAQQLQNLYEKERKRLLTKEEPAGMYDLPVFGEGSLSPFLVLIGEAPGAQEAQTGHPFVGKAGRQLDELLNLAGIAREDVYITNAVKYRPVTITRSGKKNRTPGKAEVSEGLPLLEKEIAILKPTCVVTLGNTPLGALLTLANEKKHTIGELHGQALQINLQGQQTVLFPLYHPASTIYNRELLPTCEEDIRALGRLFAVNKR